MSLAWLPPTESAGRRVEIDIRHQDILSAEADAIGCVVTPGLEPADEAGRRIFAVAGGPLREDIHWALTRRGRPRLQPGEGLTVAVRREYPVGRVGFLTLVASAGGKAPQERESLVIGAFLREALEWGFESLPRARGGALGAAGPRRRLMARVAPGARLRYPPPGCRPIAVSRS